MTKTSGEIEQEFIRDLKQNSGMDLKSWMSELQKSGIEKRNDLVKWLKDSREFRHMDASLLVGIYMNNGKPVYASEDTLLEDQLSKYDQWRPVFKAAAEFILKNFPDVRMIPKKTYVSFTAKREFAAVNIKSKEIRLGLDLGDQPFTGRLEKAKLTGPMPRISHMVMIDNAQQLDNELLSHLKESYQRVN